MIADFNFYSDDNDDISRSSAAACACKLTGGKKMQKEQLKNAQNNHCQIVSSSLSVPFSDPHFHYYLRIIVTIIIIVVNKLTGDCVPFSSFFVQIK
jgi:hypothetical protein